MLQAIRLFAHALLITTITTVHGLTVAPGQASSSSQQSASLAVAASIGDSPPADAAGASWLALLSEGAGKAAQAYRSDARVPGGVGLWTAVSSAVLFSLLACCGLLVSLREVGLAKGGPAKPGEAKKSRPASYLCEPTPRSEAGSAAGSFSYLASTSCLSVSVLGAPSPRAAPPSLGGGTTPRLCPQLVVPDSSKLQCALPDTVCHQRQNFVARICSSAARGGIALFQARVADGGDSSGIHLETLNGEERMASVSTQMVWSCPPGREPEMEIVAGSGAKYATMTKNSGSAGGYTIASGGAGTTLAVFAGRLEAHEARVVDAQGRTIAEVSPGSGQGSYEVVIFPNIDAGLIILGLLAIDKMEGKSRSAR